MADDRRDPVKITLNGEPRALVLDRDAPLLDVLRTDFGLKGTRFGCGSGQCGACFVLLDGVAVPSCNTPLWAVEGKSVTTVEGLGTPARPHPLQVAFIAEQAAQCGYCTSGILMAAAGLLARRPQPDADEIRQALARNLCRCGSHNRIVRAVLRAAQELAAVSGDPAATHR